MRPTTLAALAALLAPVSALAPRPAAAQPAAPDTSRAAPLSRAAPQDMPRLVIGAPGRCELVTGGRPQPCSSGLVYVEHRNGAVLVSVQSTQASTIGFQGNSSSQPRGEEFTLNLTRMHTSVNGGTAAKEVTGTCQISMTADGRTWHRATCRARDRNGLETVMSFTGDGRPVTAARPGEEGAGQGAPPATPPGQPAPARPAPSKG